MANFWDKLVSNPLGLLDAGISLASGIFNATSTSKTNKQNVDLTREQMQWASDEAQKEREWERPANQIAMMQEAGLSPLTYSQPVSQTSSPSIPSTHPMQPVTFNSNPFHDFLESKLLESEVKKNVQEGNKAEEEGKSIEAMRDGQVKTLYTEIKYKQALTNESEENLNVLKATQDKLLQECDTLQANAENLRAMAGFSRVQQKRLEKELDYFDYDKVREYMMQDKQMRLLDKQVELVGMQASELVHKIYSMVLSNADDELTLGLRLKHFGEEDEEITTQYTVRKSDQGLQIVQNEAAKNTVYIDKGFEYLDKIFDYVDKVISWKQAAKHLMFEGLRTENSKPVKSQSNYDGKGRLKSVTHYGR